MKVPNAFLPSRAQHLTTYDEEGRLREFNLSRQSTGGIGASNSLFATEAEHFDVMAPFLKRNREVDRSRRNYIVQPGGATIYFGDRPASGHPDPWGHGRVQYDTPPAAVSFGHFSEDQHGPDFSGGGRRG